MLKALQQFSSRFGRQPARTLRRGDADYESARRAALWNARTPDRFPDAIVLAQNADDVVAAVQLAKRENWRIGVKSGGHSWSGSHIRDGGMLIDVSRLDDAVIDKDGMCVTAGPGCKGHELIRALGRKGLYFPVGHCRGVAIGGYLLQGGFGWHGRALGPACESVVGLDIVNAEGELIHASPDENEDLYWAARGSGCGFFGVVVRFHLRVYPRPRIIGFTLRNYSIDHLEDVFRWAHQVGPEVPASIELQLLMSRHTLGVRGPGFMALAPIFSDSVKDARRDLQFFRDCPTAKKAARSVPFVRSGLGLMYSGVMQHYPENHRYAADNMWTHAKFDDLLPGLRRIAETLPPAPSHVLWMNWAPPKTRPSMAYSMEDDIYIALYSVWKNAADDHQFRNWPVERMREMEHLATGVQLADENLGQRPAKFVADKNLARLDEIRAKRDPSGRFHSWMGRP